ncbi:MAG: beta-lactamase family protein [Alphaproteobacteria bacterium]|nr:beta-lactamase family protein [Alphaproteobacteria bacterium]
MAHALQAYIDTGQLAGVSALLSRRGQPPHYWTVGRRDVAADLPVARDTIFRIASMSKPITSLAALLLIEEGRLALEDPVARYAPAFGASRVLRTPSSPLDDTVPVERPITIEDLLTHRAGLSYGAFHSGSLAAAYDAALGADIDSAVDPDAWIAGAASLPLIVQPGAAFHYGRSTDLLGLLIARIEGAPLGEVLRRRIFEPLGMADTGFTVPPDKAARRAKMYGFDNAGTLVEVGAHPAQAPAFLAARPADMTYVSGGQGLWSTLDDYHAFARLFVDDGNVGGVPVVRRETLQLLTTNRLSPEQRAQARTLGDPLFAAHGFGLGVAVVIDPENANALRCRGGVGTVGWPGAYGGWWQADPTDGSVMIFLAHNALDLDQVAEGIGLGVFGAIQEFHTLATGLAR